MLCHQGLTHLTKSSSFVAWKKEPLKKEREEFFKLKVFCDTES